MRSDPRGSGSYRPRLEILEDRLYPGDAVLGLWAWGLWGRRLASSNPPLEAQGVARVGEWDPGFPTIVSGAESLSTAVLPEDSASAGARDPSLDKSAATDPILVPTNGWDGVPFADDNLARQGAGVLPMSEAAPRDIAGTPAGLGAPWQGVREAFLALAFARNEASGGRVAALVATTGGGSAALSFDAASGQLAIREHAGEHTVREAVAADDFVDVTVDGRHHSSNPRSASFDSVLAGATAATVSGIHYDGGDQDTLILGSQQSTGRLTVQATGATVVTQSVVTAGPLAIQAPNITVRGVLQGSEVTLAASGWVTVDAAGRIDAVPSQERAGNVHPPSTITVAADVFVNSGQLHTDGPSGGHIAIQARNLLNAGPISADGTTPNGNGGQVHLAFTQSYVATTAAVLSASGMAAPGGHLTIDGGSTGRLFSSGRHLATGSVGGAIDLFGREVVLAGAEVDASGATGGGSIRLGGDFQGHNPAVGSAQTVTVTPASTIRADALRSGSGGRVSVWANQNTAFDGTVSARGGPVGGAGGLIEVSGQGSLSYGGSADAGARSGKSGTLLLDPKNLVISDAPVGVFPQFDLINPHPTLGGPFGGIFGLSVIPLSTGNVVVTSPYDDFGGEFAGAVYLFDGLTGALLSSLVGNHPHDELAGYVSYFPIAPLSNGNYLIQSSAWNGFRGAVTWGNGSTGVSGIISEANSLVGSDPDDEVGYVLAPLSNGNYVVVSPNWHGKRGAVTWGNGSTGVSGMVSEANSLVGSSSNDEVGAFPYVFRLSNGNYVVPSPSWNAKRGAATWANGSIGISGTISQANSLIGSKPGDGLGGYVYRLTNDNYVVPSSFGSRGAATWGDGSTGVRGTVSEANSLVGSHPGDYVDFVIPLSNGNYVVSSPYWNGNRGAATWGDGSTGVTGIVSEANSLVGTDPSDQVGWLVTELTNGNYVVSNRLWNGLRGAVTWVNGNTGATGTISAVHSLIGSNPGDQVGSFGTIGLYNGNYVVHSPSWNGGRGAATWGNGSTGTSGIVSEANSLVGSNPGEGVGDFFSVIRLTNGNYVVDTPSWNGNRGAATWGNGSTGVSGIISEANSLVGSEAHDQYSWAITVLTNGNYVVTNASWNGNRGSATWGDGSSGVAGTISAANSLVGSNPGDLVGSFRGGVAALPNGNYVIGSPSWNGYRGAATWGNGSTGVRGTISATNSLLGSDPGDTVGLYLTMLRLSNGNYVLESPNWNGARGAATWVSGTSGQTLDGKSIITPQNSLVGQGVNTHLQTLVEDPIHQSFLAGFVSEGGGRVRVGLTDPNQFRYARAEAQTVSLTPQFLTATLNTGTAVVLQASNDIMVNSPITVAAGGHGGALTLQAGRSLVLNASVTTDNAALNLIANDPPAHGVVDAQRDPGQAVISMAAGTTLDTGSAPLTVELGDGAGLTNRDSGAITLQAVTAGSVSVVNHGPSAGSDVQVGTVTSDGSQYYANPHGTIVVSGNLTAADRAITFTDSVVVQDDVTVTAGANAVFFVGSGIQTLHSGNGTHFGNVNHMATGMLQLTSGLTVSGSFINAAGTFDANDQPVTVAGSAALLSGTYLAGTAPQSFRSGLALVHGVFTSSTGPMAVTGGVRLLGGSLRGVGTVDTLTANGGVVAPGGDNPGVLIVSGGAAFDPATTLSVLLQGTGAGTGYSQLAIGGPSDLGGSALALTFGFEPPVGSPFEVVTNTGSAPIAGTFKDLEEGAIFTQDGYPLQITYQGGTGGKSVVVTRLA